MSLIMMSTTNGILEAIGIGAEAVSTTVTQDTGGNISESVKDVLIYPIPDMTSNTTPSGVASSNYEHSLGAGQYLYAFNAFDRDTVSYWIGLAVGHYLQYQSPTPMGIDKYDIASRSNSSATPPRGWDIHVSNDGVNWTLVDSQSNQSFSAGQVKTYTLAQSVVATYIKLTVVTLDAVGQANISEFRPYGFNSDIDTLKTTTPIADGDVLIIEKEDGSFNEIVASGVTGTSPYIMDTSIITQGEVPSKVYFASTFENDFQVVRDISMDLEFSNIADSLVMSNFVPNMTSDTSPSGVASEVGTQNSAPAWYAFNDDLDLYWECGDTNPKHLQYQFDTQKTIHSYAITISSVASWYPVDWEIHGSYDGINWTPIDTQSGQAWSSAYQRKEYSFSSSQSYEYFRMVVITPQGGRAWIALLEFIGEDGVVDTLKTTHEIVDGDKIVIVKDDDSIHEFTVSSPTIIGSGYEFTDIQASLELVSTGVLGSVVSTGLNISAFMTPSVVDNTSNYLEFIYDGDDVAIGLVTVYDTADNNYVGHSATSYSYKPKYGNKYNNNNAVGYGSNPVSGDTIRLKYIKSTGDISIEINGVDQGVMYNIGANTEAWFAVSFNQVPVGKTHTFSQGAPQVISGYEVDTSLTTIGQVPSRVFKLDAGVAFNNKFARYPVDDFTFDTTLKSTRTFDEVAVSGRTIETKVTLGKGNKMTALNANVYRKA